jgi:hypothetical protein
MAGEADEPGDLLLLDLPQGIERPAARAESVQVGERLDEMDLVEVEPVGPETLQALLELAPLTPS